MSASVLILLGILTIGKAASYEVGVKFLGPYGGEKVVDIQIDPYDTDVLYAAVCGEGIFKTTDGGERWFPINEGLGNLGVEALAINPSDPEVLFVGTRNGAYRSLDGGDHWEPLEALNSLCSCVTRFTVDPCDGDIVYAGGLSEGLFKSTDGGESWQRIGLGLSSFE